MQLKKIAMALVATGAAAALAFGGTTVSTAFTADLSTTATVEGATLDLDWGSNTEPTLNFSGLAPSQSVSQSFQYKNTSSYQTAAQTMTFEVTNFTVIEKGTNGHSPKASDVMVSIQSTDSGHTQDLGTHRLSDLLAAGPLMTSVPPRGVTQTVTITASLYDTASNASWDGAAASVTFRLHLQDGTN